MAGEGRMAGEAAGLGEGFTVGEAEAPGALMGVATPAISFHSPLRRA